MKKRDWKRIGLAGIFFLCAVTGGMKYTAGEMEEDAAAVIAGAVQSASAQPSFSIETTAELELEGSMIRDQYAVQSEIHVVQGAPEDELQMTMVNSLQKNQKEPEISQAYYLNGRYYSMDSDGKQEEEEKTPEEVMEMVTSITQMVMDASEEVEILHVEQDGENIRYTYRIPDYLAEDYLNTMAKSPIAEDTALKNAKAVVNSLLLTSTVTPEGILAEQTLELEGEVKKLLFKIPVRLSAAAEFSSDGEKALVPLF